MAGLGSQELLEAEAEMAREEEQLAMREMEMGRMGQEELE